MTVGDNTETSRKHKIQNVKGVSFPEYHQYWITFPRLGLTRGYSLFLEPLDIVRSPGPTYFVFHHLLFFYLIYFYLSLDECYLNNRSIICETTRILKKYRLWNKNQNNRDRKLNWY